jgi:predicted RNA binding protein YcfA (HicA-like mRNA interferase family)
MQSSTSASAREEQPNAVRGGSNDPGMAQFPSLKARQLLRVLTTELGYRVARQSGSHRRLQAPGRPTITFSFHDRQTIRPATVKRILCQQVGLDEDEALRLL